MRTTSTTGYKSIAAHPEIWTSRLHKIAQHTSECGPEIWMDDGIQFYAGVLCLHSALPSSVCRSQTS